MRRFFAILLVAAALFIAGVLVGRFVMPRQIRVTAIDIKDLVEIIERYNELKYELEKIKEWNKDAIIIPEPKQDESEENN